MQKFKRNLLILIFFWLIPLFVVAQTRNLPSLSTPGTNTPVVNSPTSIPQASLVPTVMSPAPVATTLLKPRVIPKIIPALVSPPVTPFSVPSTPAQSPTPNNTTLMVIISTGILGILGIFGIQRTIKKGQKQEKQEKDNNRCDSIKELLEQKKQELQDMIQDWPEQKIQAVAQEKILGVLKKNKTTEKVLDVVESVKEKYDTLNDTIEMLQKKYDLCMLELPSSDDAPYKGTIVENSLQNTKILEDLNILKTYPLEDWLLHDVTIDEKEIEKMGKYLKDGPWYMHFWQDGSDDVLVVFKDKIFKIKYSDKNTWTEAIQYGKSQGIPKEQLDFTIH